MVRRLNYHLPEQCDELKRQESITKNKKISCPQGSSRVSIYNTSRPFYLFTFSFLYIFSRNLITMCINLFAKVYLNFMQLIFLFIFKLKSNSWFTLNIYLDYFYSSSVPQSWTWWPRTSTLSTVFSISLCLRLVAVRHSPRERRERIIHQYTNTHNAFHWR